MKARARAVYELFAANDHTVIGKRVVVTAIAFLIFGGLLALLMRIQLARPSSTFMGPDRYDQVFSTHGTTMMFLFAVPMMQGLGLYFVPLMVGAKNLAFPRLASYAYWLYLIAGTFLVIALLTNTGPDAGWFSYVPLAGPEHSPGKRIGKISAALVFVGFNVTFFPQHWLGLHGMPRRIYTYLPETGWGTLSLLSTIGAFTLALGFLAFFVNGLRSLKNGEIAGPNPWNADSLEWAHPSPPPPPRARETFVVPSRYPLWIGQLGKVVGLPSDENLVTRLVDAEPDHKVKMPGPTLAPLFTAMGTAATVFMCIFTPWGLVYGAPLMALPMIAWYWPRGGKGAELNEVRPDGYHGARQP
jgi:heme/copper-type cytochrome/quinol oxidase subunit 1